MRLRRALLACAFAACALPILAQEPARAYLTAAPLRTAGGSIEFTLPWRYAPGDGEGYESPRYDDGHWQIVDPRIRSSDLHGEWPGEGWFRRHLVLDASMQDRPIAVELAAPGVGDLYVDGQLAVSSRRAAAPDVPYDHRDASIVRFTGSDHLLALHYFYPRGAPQVTEIGFLVTMREPGTAPVEIPWLLALQGQVSHLGSWVVAVQGAIIALPLFLALLHFALFGFDPRARENLFYAAEMIAFTIVLLHDIGPAFLPRGFTESFVNAVGPAGPPLAILFGLLTYYAVRTYPYPRTWKVSVIAGIAAVAASYAFPGVTNIVWSTFFVGMLVEVLRLEAGKSLIRPEPAGIFLGSFTIFCLMVVIQIFVDFGMLQPIEGVREIYLLGIVASAAGMSLHLARRMGRARIVEADNERKTRELAQARSLQLSLLPKELPCPAGMDIAAMTQTAAEVGGDYYDVRSGGNDALLVGFGDATGHGLASGIVVTAAKALFESLPPHGAPGALLGECNRVLTAMQLPALRMCLALARISPREVAIASAAMPPVLIHRPASGSITELGAGGLPLGSRLQLEYTEMQSRLAPGDTLLFASDGLAELLDPAGSPLGYDGVVAAFREAVRALTARGVIDHIAASAAVFRGTRAQADDITLLAVRIRAEH